MAQKKSPLAEVPRMGTCAACKMRDTMTRLVRGGDMRYYHPEHLPENQPVQQARVAAPEVRAPEPPVKPERAATPTTGAPVTLERLPNETDEEYRKRRRRARRAARKARHEQE